MINVSQTTKDLYLQGSVPKNITISIPNKNITITNEDIVSESMTLTETLNSSETIDFKGCIASVFKIKTVDIVQDILGEYMEVSITIQGGDTIPLFHGYIDDVSNLNHEDLTCEIVAYDRLYMLSQTDVLSWYNSLTFPITVKNFRDSLFTHLGIEQVSVVLPNDNRSLNKVYNESTMIALDVIKAICQINARLGRINREDKFEYVKLTPITEGLYPADDLYPDDELYPSDENSHIFLNKSGYKTIEYQPYKTERITGVKIYKKDGSLASSYGDFTEQFTIYDNFLVDGITSYTDFARSIYNETFQIEFIPATIDLCAYPYMETGDSVALNTMKRIVRTYILKRTMTGIQALMDRFESQCEQYQPEYKETVQTSVSANVTRIQNTNTNLNTQVTRLDNRVDDTNGRIDTTNGRVSNVETRATNLENGLATTNSNLSSLNTTVTNQGSTISTISTNLTNLTNIAITTNNWNNQTVTDSMISGMNSSKLSGTISANRLPQNMGDRDFGTISCNTVATNGLSISASSFRFNNTKIIIRSNGTLGTETS